MKRVVFNFKYEIMNWYHFYVNGNKLYIIGGLHAGTSIAQSL